MSYIRMLRVQFLHQIKFIVHLKANQSALSSLNETNKNNKNRSQHRMSSFETFKKMGYPLANPID